MASAWKAPPTVSEDLEVDSTTVHKGKVISFFKWQGYGFIEPEQKDLPCGDKVYVHWSNIQTEDRYPFLNKDMEVEFGLMKWKDWKSKGTTLRAKTVTGPDAAQVSCQDESDAKKEFVGAQTDRYTGNLKFYNPRVGFGYVTMDDGFSLGEEVPKDLRVEETEVNCGGKRPRKWLENVKVEFGIAKNKKGLCKVYNMTLPGGVAIAEDTLEHREELADERVKGTIEFFSGRQGWGFILPDESATLPAGVVTKIEEMAKASKEKGKEVKHEKCLYFRKADLGKGVWPKKDEKTPVTFKLYTDDKGAGACDIQEVEVAAA